MTTPEVDSGEGAQLEPFVRVDAIDGAGSYRFALGPNVRFKRTGYKWAVFETVPGERPVWEEQILAAIKGNNAINYSVVGLNKGRNSWGEIIWTEEKGRFISGDQAYTILVGRGIKREQSIGSLVLMDELLTPGEALGGKLVFQAEGQDVNCVLTNEALRWKGLLSVEGQPGETIDNIIGILNQQIEQNQYPLWKERELTVII